MTFQSAFGVLCGVVLMGAPFRVVVSQEKVARDRDVTPSQAALDELLRRPVTIDLTDVSRDRAIDAAAASAKVLVQYPADALDRYRDRVSLHVRGVPLSVALERILAGTTLRVVADGTSQLAIVAQDVASERDSLGTIAGRIVDSASGRGLRGATVQVNGTRLGTTTSDSGQFVLRNVPVGDRQLSIKLFGYRPVSRMITVGSDGYTPMRVTLSVMPTVLSGMVTTATGVQRRLEVGNDITRINVDSIMAHAPIANVTDLLESRVSGLSVVHTTGQPGDPARLRLRGAGSVLGSNAPIIVVDGVRMYYADSSANLVGKTTGIEGGAIRYPRPSPLDQIDPNVIETIDVLKGPSASALYGSDAANGVIIITTKRGRAGPTHWNVAASRGTTYVPGEYAPNIFRFGHFVNAEGSSFGYTVCQIYDVACQLDSLVSFQALNQPGLDALKHGDQSSGTATVSGGSSSLLYSFTGTAARSTGTLRLPDRFKDYYTSLTDQAPYGWMVHPDLYQMWSANSQLTATLGQSASLTVTNMLSNSTQRRSSLGMTFIGAMAEVYVDPLQIDQTLFRGFTERASAKTRTSTTAGELQWRVRSWLPLFIRGGLNSNDDEDTRWTPAGLPFQIADTTGAYAFGTSTVTERSLSAGTNTSLPLAATTHLNLALGVNVDSRHGSSTTLQTTGIPLGVEDPSGFIQGNTTTGRGQFSAATYGWYAEPTMAFPGSVFISPGFSLDGGTTSGSNAGLTVFPKINGSWIVLGQRDRSSAPAWRRALNLVRLRGAVGVAGVQPSPAQQLRLYQAKAVTLNGGGGTQQALTLGVLGNTLLRPERTREFEAGFDADLLNQRVSLSLTHAYKKRLDAIIGMPVAPSVAGDYVTLTHPVNIGAIRNTSLEGSAQVRLLDTRAVQWSVDMNVTSAKNVVLSLGDARDFAYTEAVAFASQPRVIVGYPLFGVWAKPLAGYADVNGNGLIDPSEIVISDSAKFVGGTDPRYTAGFGTNIGFFNNRLTFTALTSYQDGLTQLGGANGALQNAANAPGASLLQQAIFVASNYVPHGAGQPLYSAGTDYYRYQTVNTFRLQSLSINYILPTSIARRFWGQNMSVALQGSNLFLHTNYHGKDPNVNAYPSGNAVQDLGQLPEPRSWTFQVRLGN